MSRSIVVVTTLLAPQQATKEDLAALDRARWNAEFDLRLTKSATQMHELRCKTPELVRKRGVGAHRPNHDVHRLLAGIVGAQKHILPRSSQMS